MIEPKMFDQKSRSSTWTGPSSTVSPGTSQQETATKLFRIDAPSGVNPTSLASPVNMGNMASPVQPDQASTVPPVSSAEVVEWANALMSIPTGSVVADITHPPTGYSAPAALVRHYLDSAVTKYKQPKTYSRKVLLTIQWEDDDCGATEDSSKMEELMEEIFEFTVEREKLPQKKPERIAISKIMNFIARHDEDEGSETPSLFIFHYVGHGRYKLGNSKTREKTLEIGGWASGKVWIPFEEMREEMLNCHADVLILMDCCYSAIAARGAGTGRTVEIIAAGGEMERVGAGNVSFTHFFDLAARTLAKTGQSFSIECIHRLMVRAKSTKPKILPITVADQSGSSDMSRNTSSSSDVNSLSSATSDDENCPNLGPIYNEDGRIYSRVPFYQKREGSESIKLHPIQAMSKKVVTPPTTGLWKGEVLIGIIIHVTEDPSSSEVELLTKHIHERLSVRPGFTATVLKKIQSDSTLILAAIPSPIYECLPSHPALMYVGVISSHDPSIFPEVKPPSRKTTPPSELIVTKRSLVSIPRVIRLNKRPSFGPFSKPLTSRLFRSDAVALGRLVANIDAPEPDYCPALPGEIVNIDNVVEMSLRIPTSCGQMKKHDRFVMNAKLTELFSGVLDKRACATAAKGTTVGGRAYSMVDANSCFQSMRDRSGDVRKWIEKYNRHGSIFMVVAIATVRKVTQADESKTSLQIGADDTVGNEISRPGDSQRCVSAPGVGEKVIAIEYQKVQFGWFSGHKTDKASLAKGSHILLRQVANDLY
jgi:hypothetical protein